MSARRPIPPLLFALLYAAAPLAAAYPPAVRGMGGAVAAEEPLATAAGLEALRAGGNAVDAAVATALALAVVFPEAGNLGGGGFAVVKMGQELATLDFRETAPAAAHRTMFLDDRGEPIPHASRYGGLAAGVPGSPAGYYELHRRFGRLPWQRVVAPALRLAGEELVVGEHLHRVLGDHEEGLSRFPETAALWLRDGEPLPVGARVRLSDLAATLALYAERGPAGVTEGRVAAAVEAVARAHGGVLRAADLAAYRPAWREPLRFRAWGWDFAAMPLPSAGGTIVGQTLGVLERLRWDELPRFGADRWHLLAETFRRAFADRTLLSDPATARATPAELLAPRRLEAFLGGLDRRRATPSVAVRAWEPGAPPAGGGDTTHLSVVDGDGNLVALTTTLNDLFGGGLYVPGAGFFLNDEMDDFTTVPGRAAAVGQGEANAVAPGKRMLSSMAPTLAWRGGEGLVVGGRGGRRIPTGTAQALLNLLVDGDELGAALARPRVHHQWLPDRLEAEADALAPETRAELERRGHAILVPKPKDIPKLTAVRRLAGGRVEAATDPRGAAPRDGAGVAAPDL
ncbi:MAG TPA: gamma-glutamyltransferase [Thermoanaerobaculia bacterium]|nr:gamma-glutamyltransferase [Thermoanaerobaculia bacterium]